MKYSLRSLMIAALLLPPLAAAIWFAAQVEWSDEILLIAAILCAVPYWLGIGILLARNPRQPSVWVIAVAALVIFPCMFFLGISQLALAIPVWVVLLLHGSDVSKPISAATAGIAIAVTLLFFGLIFASILSIE
jgi:hypothetical protein